MTDSDVQQHQNLEECLQGWRCVLVNAYPVVTWDKPQHPYILSAAIAFVFLIIWLSNATILTTISIIGIVVTLADYLVPIISRNYLEPRFWKDSDEDKYKKIVFQISETKQAVSSFFNTLKNLKNSNPKLYFSILLSVLIISAWIGNLVNNLFLTFILVNLTVLLPGLRSHGYLEKATEQVKASIGKVFGQKKKD